MRRLRHLAELPVDIQKVIRSGAPRTTGLLCPWCEGGQGRERSLGVYLIVNEAVLKCYRLSCGETARLYLDGDTAHRAAVAANGFEPRPFLDELHELSFAAKGWFRGKYRLERQTLEDAGVREIAGIHGAYLPVRGPLGSDRGGIVRRFDGWGQKADAYKTADEPWQAWYLAAGDPRGHVIVEDQLSAMRAQQLGWSAVALLGTGLSMDRAAELNRAAPSWTLALDADAFSAACKIAQQHSWIDRVVMLKHGDLKDITDEHIEEALHA